SFCRAYPGHRFELLSPLAEGADRLAAEVALARGITLRVPMPMVQSEYEKDFPERESLEEFRKLLNAAEASWLVRADDVSTDDSLRDNQYAAVGDYIARSSHVLILLWDGEQNDKLGGTGWVKMRRDFWVAQPHTDSLKPAPPGYLETIHIVTPREISAQSGEEPPRIRIIGQLPQLQ
ncbi:MAG: hypothetical protein ACJ8M4_10820, partial [Chthoniobacterales bacterium]